MKFRNFNVTSKRQQQCTSHPNYSI